MPIEIKQRQAFGAINGNRQMPAMQARQMPTKPGMMQAPGQMKRMPPQQPSQEEKMVVVEVVRPSVQGRMPVSKDMPPPQPMQGPMRMSAPAQRAFSTQSSAKSDGSISKTVSMKEIGMTKTISVKETTFVVGPVTAQKGCFQLEDVKAKVQIQPPTPLNVINHRSMAPTAPRSLPDDEKQARIVEQWLANQRPPPQAHADDEDTRSTYSAASSAGPDIKSVYDFSVTNVGATRTRTFEQMPAPGSFMHGGPGEGPGLVC